MNDYDKITDAVMLKAENLGNLVKNTLVYQEYFTARCLLEEDDSAKQLLKELMGSSQGNVNDLKNKILENQVLSKYLQAESELMKLMLEIQKRLQR